MKMKRFVSLLLAAFMVLALAGCGSLNLGSPNTSEPKLDGYLGDTLSTYWFDFTVDDAYLCGEYEGYTPDSGYQMLVVTLSMKSTVNFSVDMFQSDFPVLWADGDSTDGTFPISAFTDDQLPDEYTLGINRSKSGLLVYEVPEDKKDFSLAFMEVFEEEGNEDGQEGETYFVDFTPTKK